MQRGRKGDSWSVVEAPSKVNEPEPSYGKDFRSSYMQCFLSMTRNPGKRNKATEVDETPGDRHEGVGRFSFDLEHKKAGEKA